MNRKAHWERIYGEKNPGKVSWYQKEPLLSLDLIENAVPDKAAEIIDVGGGASALVDYLLNRGRSNLCVLDISTNALEYAKSRLGSKSEIIEWIEADVTIFQPPRSYDLWHDRAVFHFLTSATDRKGYVASLSRALKPGGRAIIATFAIGGPTKCSGLDIVQYDAAKMAVELGREFQLEDTREEIHLTPAGMEQKFIFLSWLRIGII